MTAGDGARLAWVLGARGLLGRQLEKQLSDAGFEVIATARETDIRDPAALRKAIGGRRPAVIFNAAAFTAVDAAEIEPANARAVNTIGAWHMAELARELGADFVHFSTDYVYAGRAPTTIGEDSETAPLNVYGETKREGDALVVATIEPGRRVFVVRTSWLFGPGRVNFVDRMLELMAARARIEVVDDQFGRPTASVDLAQAAIRLWHIRPESGVYHFANTGITSWHGFAVAIHQAAIARGFDIRARDIVPVSSSAFPRPALRPTWSVLGTGKIEELLPIRPWTDALAEHLDGLGTAAPR